MQIKFMPKKSVFIIILSGILVFFLIANYSDDIKDLFFPSNDIRIVQHATYIALPYEEIVNTADIIFVGRVTNISASKWNQDNGEYWGDYAIQYHTIQFEVSKFIVDKIGAADQKTVEITLIGDVMLIGTSVPERNQDYNLQIGDEVLVFAGKTDFAWREGSSKSVIMLRTAPSLSFFVRKPNGNFEGQAFYSTGQGYTSVETVSLPLSDLTAQIQSILENSPTP